MLRLFAAAVLLLGSLIPQAAGDEPAPTADPVETERVAPGTTWDGQQYVAADHKGRVYLLRTDSLQVYPIDGLELGEPRRIEAAGLDDPLPVLDASMDKHGDWVLLHGHEPRWLRSGKEKTLPELRWLPASIEILDGRPVVAVFPFPVGRWSSSELESTTPPRVVAHGNDDWDSIIDSEFDGPAEPEDRMRVRHEQAAHSFVDSNDTLWLAHQYRYKVDRFSASGREMLSVSVDGANVKHEAEEDLEGRRIELEEERARLSNPGRAKIRMSTARSVIEALTEGRDGRLYLLVRGEGGGLLLDRIDTVRAIVERVPIKATTPGAVSMAAGKDGLYIVPFNGKRPRLFVPWQTLEQVPWSPLEGVDGFVPVGEDHE